MRRPALLLLVLGMILALASPAWAISYQFTLFDPPEALNTFPGGINDAGRIAGVFTNVGPNVERAFIREPDGTITVFNAPGASDTTNILNFRGTGASGINNAGQVAGFFNDGSRIHGFRRESDATTFTNFDVPGHVNLFTGGINAAGAIVGAFTDSSVNLPSPTPPSFSGFLRDAGGNFTLFDVPGAISAGTQPGGINDAGLIVGFFEDGAGVHGFLRDLVGNFTTIDVPGASLTRASEIDNAGRIVGDFDDAAGAHGFLRDLMGNFTTIDVPGEGVTGVGGINDLGQIAGGTRSIVLGNFQHGFLGNPVPGPPTLGLMVCGLLAMGTIGYRLNRRQQSSAARTVRGSEVSLLTAGRTSRHGPPHGSVTTSSAPVSSS
jgi:hypothetical protein